MTCRPSILDGIDVTVLQQRLAQMQQVYLDISSGAKVEVASYAQADGSRTISYSKANIADLVAAIQAVQSQIASITGIGSVARRRPLRPYFGGRP